MRGWRVQSQGRFLTKARPSRAFRVPQADILRRAAALRPISTGTLFISPAGRTGGVMRKLAQNFLASLALLPGRRRGVILVMFISLLSSLEVENLSPPKEGFLPDSWDAKGTPRQSRNPPGVRPPSLLLTRIFRHSRLSVCPPSTRWGMEPITDHIRRLVQWVCRGSIEL